MVSNHFYSSINFDLILLHQLCGILISILKSLEPWMTQLPLKIENKNRLKVCNILFCLLLVTLILFHLASSHCPRRPANPLYSASSLTNTTKLTQRSCERQAAGSPQIQISLMLHNPPTQRQISVTIQKKDEKETRCLFKRRHQVFFFCLGFHTEKPCGELWSLQDVIDLRKQKSPVFLCVCFLSRVWRCAWQTHM